MDLTITIASYNSRQVTRYALRSIFEHTQTLRFEVIVVDNASEDGSADMIEHEFPLVHLVRSSKNLGFAAAHNLAMQQSRGDNILVLNSDVQFLDNAARKMVQTLQLWPGKAGALGPRILNVDGSYAPSASYRQFPPRALVGVAILNQVFPFVHHLPIEWFRKRFGPLLARIHGKFLQPTTAERVEWLDGMSVLFRRQALEEAGLFDEQFFFDMEIGDLLHRLRGKGWEVVYDPGIAIVHLGGYSRRGNPRILRQSVRSMLVYYAKLRPGYIPLIQVLYNYAIWAKLRVLTLTPGSKDAIELYYQIRSDVREFSVASVRINEAIPHLPEIALNNGFSKGSH